LVGVSIWGERYGPENEDRIGSKSSPQFLEDGMEELGVRERSYSISCELKLVAL